MGKDENVHTAYKNYAPEAQEQKLPGGDVDMEPLAEHASLLSSLAMVVEPPSIHADEP